MKLTHNTAPAILYAPCNSKGGLGTPRFTGAKTPLPLVVFSFLRSSLVTGLIRVKFVMAGVIYWGDLRLTAPVAAVPTQQTAPPPNNWNLLVGDTPSFTGKSRMTNPTQDAPHAQNPNVSSEIDEDNYILGLISMMSPIFKSLYFNILSIKYDNLKPANDAVYSFTRKKESSRQRKNNADKTDGLAKHIESQ